MESVTLKYRCYPDGTIVWEEDFHEYDNALPYYDDYFEGSININLCPAVEAGFQEADAEKLYQDWILKGEEETFEEYLEGLR